MRSVSRAIFFLSCLLMQEYLHAQGDVLRSGYENGTNLNVLYKTERMGKIYGTPRGFGALYRYTKHVTAKRRSYYEVDIQTLKHPKETKVEGSAISRKRYVYGKVNSVFVLRGGLGLQDVLFAKADAKAVEIRYSFSLGPLVAIAKPYYLQLYSSSVGAGKLIKFDSADFNSSSSVGRANFGSGLNELKFYPGATARFNLSFEYAPYTNILRAIETGICLDFYPRALPIMARNPAENLIVTFNVGFLYGRKWF
jgi:hypothetical protein